MSRLNHEVSSLKLLNEVLQSERQSQEREIEAVKFRCLETAHEPEVCILRDIGS